jgi:23S rRNA (guanosine2251-2'-O)-methyltransferase
MPKKPRHSNEYNRPRGNAPSLPPRKSAPGGGGAREQTRGYWIYGWHAVIAALSNPERMVHQLTLSPQAAERLTLPNRRLPAPNVMEPRAMDQWLGSDTVHQGIAARVEPLEPYMLEDILNIADPSGPVLILDQVSDPHNVGAILRTAAAYDAVAVVVPRDHSAPETAVMAKAACGGLDLVKRVVVTNLANALRELQNAGWWVVGLDGEATTLLHTIEYPSKTALVLGAEGKGMRRLTSERCDQLVRLPISGRMESLNVSNAAAVALHHLATSRSHG